MNIIHIHFLYRGKPRARTVSASIIGPLAVHRTPLPRSQSQLKVWTVTHLATGRSVYRFFGSKADAVSVANHLKDHPGWASDDYKEIIANLPLKALVESVMRSMGFKWSIAR